MRIKLLYLTMLFLVGCEQVTDSGHQSSVAEQKNLLSQECDLGVRGFQQANGYPENIQLLQKQTRFSLDTNRMENLAWAYVSYSQNNNSPEHLYLAGNLVECMEQQKGKSPETRLLDAHILHQQHQFEEAEIVAASLAADRGSWFDHAVYGDVLVERGKLDQAAKSYQRMADIKPGAESYGRIGHLRWLKGDIEGAIELLTMAAKSSNPLDTGGSAFWHTRLAYLLWLNRQHIEAMVVLDHVSKIRTDYDAAQFLRGRILLSQGSVKNAVEILEELVSQSAQPEYLWGLWEAYTASGQSNLAREIKQRLISGERGKDRRTLSLFLSHLDIDHVKANQLATAEIRSRKDALTLDALALSQFKLDQIELAENTIQLALDSGAIDPRLFMHAAQIGARKGNLEAALRWSEHARQYQHLLWPSELHQLDQLILETDNYVQERKLQIKYEFNI